MVRTPKQPEGLHRVWWRAPDGRRGYADWASLEDAERYRWCLVVGHGCKCRLNRWRPRCYADSRSGRGLATAGL